MAKLKAHKKRRVRLRRGAVVLLVIVALLATAIGIVTLRIKAIVLSALRKELPNCEVSVGRVTLNPFSNLKIYDLRIEDRSTPDARSTIELDHAVAHYSITGGLKFDIDLDVARPAVVLDSTGGTPFPDLFEREPSGKPSRFRLKQVSLRDCRLKIHDPALTLDASFGVQARDLGEDDRELSLSNCQVKLAGETFTLAASIEAAVTGLALSGSSASASAQAPADIDLVLSDLAMTTESAAVVQNADGTQTVSDANGRTTLKVARLEGKLSYDAAQPELLDRLLLHKLRAAGGEVQVRYPDVEQPDFRVSGGFEVGLANASGNLRSVPTKLTVESGGIDLEAGLLMTYPMRVAIDGNLDAGDDGRSARLAGTFTAVATKAPEDAERPAELNGTITGLLDKTGLHVTTVFENQKAQDLVTLFVDDTDEAKPDKPKDGEAKHEHKIPVIHDFTLAPIGDDEEPGEPMNVIDRFELDLAYTPALGFGLTGAIVADGLEGRSEAMMLTVEGIKVDTTFSLLPPERGAALELIVGDPTAVAGPGVITADRVIWDAPGDMHFPANKARGHLWSEDYVWTLGNILGTVFDGEGTGTIQALADGTVTLDLQFKNVNLRPFFAAIVGQSAEDDQMTGLADAKVAITLKSTDTGMALDNIDAELHTLPPGGLLMLKKKEKSFNSLPGGEKVLGAVKQQMSPRFYDHFLEKFKNYHYESITIEARKSGNEYLLDVKVRDADKKNPLPIDLTIRYSVVHIYHDEGKPQ